ncbi:MAG: hypothetical protein QXO71_10620 [Candidatus Jordarchaeaceae archaeon]
MGENVIFNSWLGMGVFYREMDGGSDVCSNVGETALELQCSSLESYCIIFLSSFFGFSWWWGECPQAFIAWFTYSC